MTPNDTIIVKLQYPVKILGLNMSFNRKIGFSFTNLYKALLYIENDCKTMTELKKTKSDAMIFNETLYFAAVAYCQLNKKKQNFTKEKLIKSFGLTDQSIVEQIFKTWSLSENFGATVKQSKKKVK
ncbi:MAG: hypothetical protein ACM3KI_11150 [Bacillota bacterium]